MRNYAEWIAKTPGPMLRNDRESSQRCFDTKLKLFAVLLANLSLEEACCVVHEVREQLMDDLQRRRVTLL